MSEELTEIPSVDAQRVMTEALTRKIQECRWSNSITIDTDSWKTQCNNEHCFIDGGPKENEYQFCPYCGKRLVVA